MLCLIERSSDSDSGSDSGSGERASESRARKLIRWAKNFAPTCDANSARRLFRHRRRRRRRAVVLRAALGSTKERERERERCQSATESRAGSWMACRRSRGESLWSSLGRAGRLPQPSIGLSLDSARRRRFRRRRRRFGAVVEKCRKIAPLFSRRPACSFARSFIRNFGRRHLLLLFGSRKIYLVPPSTPAGCRRGTHLAEAAAAAGGRFDSRLLLANIQKPARRSAAYSLVSELAPPPSS